jgi:hypothetical protein
MGIFQIIQLIFLIIAFAIIAFIINWLYKMDKCACARKIPEKKYLKEWFVFIFIYSVIIHIILYTYENYHSPKYLTFMLYLNIIIWIVAIINIVMFIRMFMYILKLREIKCNCGMLKQQTFIYYYQIVAFTIMGLSLFLLLTAGLLFAINYKKITKLLR